MTAATDTYELPRVTDPAAVQSLLAAGIEDYRFAVSVTRWQRGPHAVIAVKLLTGEHLHVYRGRRIAATAFTGKYDNVPVSWNDRATLGEAAQDIDAQLGDATPPPCPHCSSTECLLQRLYRRFAACIRVGCDRGDAGNVVRAKRLLEYRAVTCGRLEQPNLAGDEFYRLVYQGSDPSLYWLTGHDRAWWVAQYNAVAECC